ncbi:hypothetical protein FACS1894187_04940 [Synergistales bacterium]|nr:hypothetical protein FACS1894187_04940 [Synergistales bacterium]
MAKLRTSVQSRRGASSEWIVNNPILLAGECGLEVDTGKIKYGDGVRHWVDLPYSGGGGGGQPGPAGPQGEPGPQGIAGIDGDGAIPTAYFFSGAAARDAYFTSNPGELEQNTRVAVGNPAQVQQYVDTAWVDMTSMFVGPQGPQGPAGSGGGAVTSVAGKTGDVNLYPSDLGAVSELASSTGRAMQSVAILHDDPETATLRGFAFKLDGSEPHTSYDMIVEGAEAPDSDNDNPGHAGLMTAFDKAALDKIVRDVESIADASESEKGITMFATAEEVGAGEVENKAVSPKRLHEQQLGGGYNTREIITTSGAWIAPMTGWYRFEIRGGGGGGGGSGGRQANLMSRGCGGGGGGRGRRKVVYLFLIADQSILATIGAGGIAGAAGASGGSNGGNGGNGGMSSVAIAGTNYTAEAGTFGYGSIGITGNTLDVTIPYGAGGQDLGSPGMLGVNAEAFALSYAPSRHSGDGGNGGAFGDGLGGDGGKGGAVRSATTDASAQPGANGVAGQRGVVVIDFFDPAKTA